MPSLENIMLVHDSLVYDLINSTCSNIRSNLFSLYVLYIVVLISSLIDLKVFIFLNVFNSELDAVFESYSLASMKYKYYPFCFHTSVFTIDWS